jgi:hypothetical protein
MLSAVVWFAGMVGRRIVWRGETFLLEPDGRLLPLTEIAPQPDTIRPA